MSKTCPIQDHNAYLDTSQYQTLYQHSIHDPNTFWSEQAKKFIEWFEPFKTVQNGTLNIR